MRCADIAMYSAKARGKNRVERFTESGHGEIAQLRLLEEHLAHAVERGEIVLHYQPHVDLRTGRCVGAEVLARWEHPNLGLLPPGPSSPWPSGPATSSSWATTCWPAPAARWPTGPGGQRPRGCVWP
jgi:EAL domain